MNWQQFYSGTRADLKPGDRFYHGTRADLKPGDLIKPGHPANFGKLDRVTTYVYFSATLDAGVWGAELARGEGPGRIYLVEPTGPFTDDPNLTDKRFPGNPTKSYRSREPLRVLRDRKSTRLNSSHITTSYAVFCLKKKNKSKKTAINIDGG